MLGKARIQFGYIHHTNLLASGDELHLRHTVHGIDVVHAFDTILIALMHAVDADVARQAIGLWRAATTDGNPGWVGFSPMPPLVLVRAAAAQVVQVGNRETPAARSAHRQTLGARAPSASWWRGPTACYAAHPSRPTRPRQQGCIGR